MVGIEPKTFDFVSNIVQEVESNAKGISGQIGSGSAVMILAGSVFEQFYDVLGHRIAGFSKGAKLRAAQLLEGEPKENGPDPEARRVIAVFEAFCDLAKDLEGNYNASPVRYATAVALVERLLGAVESWAASRSPGMIDPSLLGRIQQAQSEIGALS